MDKIINIGEISDLISIPKSTLRYWDSVGLISLPRNKVSNYREYSLNIIYDIGDIAFYRDLHISIDEIKSLTNKNANQLTSLLTEKEQAINQEIENLQKAIHKIHQKKEHINEYHHLLKYPYRQEVLDITKVVEFPVYNKDAWKICFQDPYQYMIYMAKDCTTITNVISYDFYNNQEKSDQNINAPIIYLDTKKTYVTCVLKVNYSDRTKHNLIFHIDQLKSLGYQVGEVFARFLFTGLDDINCDVSQSVSTKTDEKDFTRINTFDYFKAYISVSK